MAPSKIKSARSKEIFISKSESSVPRDVRTPCPPTPASSDRARSSATTSGTSSKRSASAAQIDGGDITSEAPNITTPGGKSKRVPKAAHESRKRARTEDVPIPSIEITNAANGFDNHRITRPEKQIDVNIYSFEDVEIDTPITEYISSRRESLPTTTALEAEHSLRGWRTTGFMDLLVALTRPNHRKKHSGTNPFLRRFTKITREKKSTARPPTQLKAKPRWEWTEDEGRHGDTGKIDGSNILDTRTRRKSAPGSQSTSQTSTSKRRPGEAKKKSTPSLTPVPRRRPGKSRKTSPLQTSVPVEQGQPTPAQDADGGPAPIIPTILTSFPEVLDGEERESEGFIGDGDEYGVFIDSGSVTTIHYEGKEYIDFRRIRPDTGEEERFWILAQRKQE